VAGHAPQYCMPTGKRKQRQQKQRDDSIGDGGVQTLCVLEEAAARRDVLEAAAARREREKNRSHR
jgi:hypothetical protein